MLEHWKRGKSLATAMMGDMELNSRQELALRSICDTFVPLTEGLPSAAEMGVPGAILEAVERLPREADRRKLSALLRVWDAKLTTALAGCGYIRFSDLPKETREKVLRTWRDSRIPARRATFRALQKGALLNYYALTGADGRNPLWEKIGYPGPIGSVDDPPPKKIHTRTPVKDETLQCDVCVIGSGAGGATAAAVLASAGLDVVILEAGDYYDDADFDGAELSGYRRMYMAGGAVSTHDESVGLLAGRCLGGGTVVNYTTSFKTPRDVREEWAALGAHTFREDAFDDSLDAVCDRLGVNTDHNLPSNRDEIMRRGAEALGWHIEAMPRNVRDCDQDGTCGYCGFGCRLGAKMSATKTWLADADEAGARILTGTEAHSITSTRGRADGVIATGTGGVEVRIRSRAVVVAAGSIETPALLRRSGMPNPNIGKHLRLHPATAVWGVFDEEVEPWTGTMQALYSDQFRDIEDGYGVKYETAAVHPSLLAGFLPWDGSEAHYELMCKLPYLSPIGVLLRDHGFGEVRVGRDGRPDVRYRLTDKDVEHVRVGVRGAVRILEAAGASTIFSSHSRLLEYEPGGRGGIDEFMRQADACGWGAGQCTFYSFHIMGSARMGGSMGTSVANPEGETWDLQNAYICDASAFPTAPGVNPMISIAAIAHLNASRLARKLT